MSVTLRYKGRLPGVVVNTALPPAEAPLRLDVAGFVGFAERGPLNTPVALEDISQYEAVFGGDLAVARDGGRPIYAALPSAVRAFFDNGGRRCYAVRVAGAGAARALLRPPGLVALDDAGNPRPALVEAAWVGRWAEQLGVWTQLLARPLKLVDAPLAAAGAPRELVLDLASPTVVAPGDLLRLTFQPGEPLAYFPVADVQQQRALVGVGRGVPVAVRAPQAALWAFRRRATVPADVSAIERLSPEPGMLLPGADPGLEQLPDGYALRLAPEALVRPGDLLRITCGGGATLLFPVARATAGRAETRGLIWSVTAAEQLEDAAVPLPLGAAPGLEILPAGYALRLAPEALVRPGDLLRITCGGGATLLFPVARATAGRAESDDAAWPAAEPAPSGPPTRVELLRFALRVRLGETVRERFEELSFAAGAGGWGGRLCAWRDDSDAGPPSQPPERSSLLRTGPGAVARYLPLGMRELSAADEFFGPLAKPVASDGLDAFEPCALFLDDRLSGRDIRALMPEAERLLYLSEPAAHLAGVHSLIPVDEVALLAIPDLAQRGWPASTLPLPVDPPPPALPPPAPPDWSHFSDCAQPAPPELSPEEVVRRFYGFLVPITVGNDAPGLDASARALLADELRARLASLALPAALDADGPALGFAVSPPPCAVEGADQTMILGTLTLLSGVEVRTDFALARHEGRWLIEDLASRLAPATQSEAQRRLARLPLLKPPREYRPDDLVCVQAALIKLCAARGDMTAVLSLPGHYSAPEAAEWRERLDTLVGLPGEGPLSYAAAYHPWLQQRELATPELAPLRALPPDGAVCGTVAARELARGVWVAPAGLPLRGVVGLDPALSEAQCGELFDAPTQINPLRQQPGRFVAISAHTLSPTPIYWQLAVRRLLILLRKLALRRGMQYVFESNNERFRRQVQGSFERALAQLAASGALAAYQVVADAGLNTPNDIDNGRFLIALKVAPVAPVEFITVTLLRSGEGLLDVVER